jgi:2-oxoglutarate dehydrogenase E1 component
MAAPDEQQILDTYRRWGYLAADLDPLGHLEPFDHPELSRKGKTAERARRIYCGAIGAEFMHLPEPERREWVAGRMESDAPALAETERQRLLELLARADLFEQVLQSRYLGTKRFSVEGNTALLPLLETMLAAAAADGAVQAVLAMSHRGRLSVMVNSVGRPAAEVFAGFEDVDPRSVLGSGDVKYHMGATGTRETAGGRIHIHLVSNPSHLEAVDPVALGRTRAKQARLGDNGQSKVVPIILHGDGAFAGQGVTGEALNLHGVRGFTVGGSVHVIVNNLIGFTTNPAELHGTRFASDAAKRVAVPIFHVNGEDPEAVVRVARMAMDYRYRFGSPVVVDLIGFRRHGHSEVDDPTITQPIRYRKIQERPRLWESYAERIGADAGPLVKRIRAEYEAAQREALDIKKKPMMRQMPEYWSRFAGGKHKPEYEVDTGVPAKRLGKLAASLTRAPESFHVHPKVKRLLDERARMGRGEKPVDYGFAEALAFASLLTEGVRVRLSGQDTRRGTFNQRHAALIDTESEEEYVPLEHLAADQAPCEILNSTLSEAGVLGFEYGFARDFPEALVCWEAQFGDFANNAQVIIDQFIAAGEDKWALLAGVVLLLPHGYEGQGPEHSSARIERFLQLAAEDNIQVAQPSTAAQYFHLLRRQALRPWRKPLVVFTPKSMLRHPDAASPLDDLAAPRFQTVLDDAEIRHATRVLFATGKIVHELRRERQQRKDKSTAIVSLEQLYPFPEAEISAVLDHHREVRELVWVQEEPANMGAHFFVLPHLERLARGRPVRSIKRSASASPATGSPKAHEVEQRTLLTLAFSTGRSSSAAASD